VTKIGLILWLFWTDFSFTMSPIKSHHLAIKYEYETTYVNGDRGKYVVFFLIDSTVYITYKKRTYYQLTFSADSSEKTGYVRYDTNRHSLDFISKDYRNPQKYCSSTTIQHVFMFANCLTNKICSFGVLGGGVMIKAKRQGKSSPFLFNMKIIETLPIPSETRVIKELYFQDCPYPAALLVDDPTLEKAVEVKGVRLI